MAPRLFDQPTCSPPWIGFKSTWKTSPRSTLFLSLAANGGGVQPCIIFPPIAEHLDRTAHQFGKAVSILAGAAVASTAASFETRLPK